jgi:acetoin utilization deacetylase AcuC-like enzyme
LKTVFSVLHTKHAPKQEFAYGKMWGYFEKPERAKHVLRAVKDRKLGEIIAPDRFAHDAILAIHTPDYVRFLQDIHPQWAAEGHKGDVIASGFNVQHKGARAPRGLDGRAGYYLADTTTPVTPTSWQAIESSAFSALTAQKLIAAGESAAFALCRPPGHHATAGVAAGYCYLNNAAIAAQAFIDDGAKRVAVLDIDYHHGNGTQDIFYGRNDVLTVSLHADPADDYPFFAGYADEAGAGAGDGFNHNYVLPLGTEITAYADALKHAVTRIEAYAPDALIVALGVDTFEKDPISKFKIRSEDYLTIGNIIAATRKPTMFTMEGGYAVEDVGINAVNVLEGFLQQ